MSHRGQWLACLSLLLTIPALVTGAAQGQTLSPPDSSAPTAQPPGDELDRGPSVGGSRVGYVDTALPFNQIRLRYETGYNLRRPNRAEFFYAQNKPNGPGLPVRETGVDYQDFTAYVEYAPGERWSAFFEVPTRLLNPDVNDNTAGLGDVSAGLKYAFLYQDDLVTTFQLRTFAPSGDASRGLGTRHVSLEPALLLWSRLSDRLTFEAELRYWVPVGGTDFAGDIIRYGVGLSYDLLQVGDVRLLPVVEFVGWTVLDGKKTVVTPAAATDPALPVPVMSAAGDTIVNVKLGTRFQIGCRSDLYAGYGLAVTGDKWYESLFRLDFRWKY